VCAGPVAAVVFLVTKSMVIRYHKKHPPSEDQIPVK